MAVFIDVASTGGRTARPSPAARRLVGSSLPAASGLTCRNAGSIRSSGEPGTIRWRRRPGSSSRMSFVLAGEGLGDRLPEEAEIGERRGVAPRVAQRAEGVGRRWRPGRAAGSSAASAACRASPRLAARPRPATSIAVGARLVDPPLAVAGRPARRRGRRRRPRAADGCPGTRCRGPRSRTDSRASRSCSKRGGGLLGLGCVRSVSRSSSSRRPTTSRTADSASGRSGGLAVGDVEDEAPERLGIVASIAYWSVADSST